MIYLMYQKLLLLKLACILMMIVYDYRIIYSFLSFLTEYVINMMDGVSFHEGQLLVILNPSRFTQLA